MMKKTFLFILIFCFMTNTVFALNKFNFHKNSTCPAGYFCLSLNTPIQTGYVDESYDLVISSKVILQDGDKVMDHYEVEVPAGNTLDTFDPSSFQQMTLHFEQMTHLPGNNQPNDVSQALQNCEMTYQMEPGMHYISIYRNADGSYGCY